MGDSCDDALAETVIGPLKAEVIHHQCRPNAKNPSVLSSPCPAKPGASMEFIGFSRSLLELIRHFEMMPLRSPDPSGTVIAAYGYVRVSTIDQDLTSQEQALRKATAHGRHSACLSMTHPTLSDASPIDDQKIEEAGFDTVFWLRTNYAVALQIMLLLCKLCPCFASRATVSCASSDHVKKAASSGPARLEAWQGGKVS